MSLLESLLQMGDALLELEHHQIRKRKGRPRVEILEEQLIFFTQHNFRVAEIARLFGRSRRIVEQHMQE